MRLSLASALVLAIAIFGVSYASAQDRGGEPMPEELAECEQLDIDPEDCNETAILQKLPRSSPVQPENPHMDLIPLYLGIAGAFAAGIIYVKKTGRWKTKTP